MRCSKKIEVPEMATASGTETPEVAGLVQTLHTLLQEADDTMMVPVPMPIFRTSARLLGN